MSPRRAGEFHARNGSGYRLPRLFRSPRENGRFKRFGAEKRASATDAFDVNPGENDSVTETVSVRNGLRELLNYTVKVNYSELSGQRGQI